MVKLFNSIFSVNNEKTHKVVKIFGIKIKQRNKFKELEAKYNNLNIQLNEQINKLAVIQNEQNENIKDVLQQMAISSNNEFELLKLKNISLERSLLLANKKIKFLNNNKKPSVAFILYHRAHWAMDSVFQAMKEAGFDISIIISPAMEIEESLREKELNDNYAFFSNFDCNVIKGFDFQTNKAYDLNSNLPDIIIYQTHWMHDYISEFNIKNFYNKALCVSIPYGYFVASIQQEQFNQEFHQLVWLNFAETEFAHEMAKKYADNKAQNVIVTGYPKMDSLYNNDLVYEWKNKNNKKIIWAPHYSINTDWQINFANFHLYYKKFLQYVQKNHDIDMLLKPHPMLKSRCIQTNTLTGSEYDNYVCTWNSMKNGIYENKGKYFDIFKSSDAMILDSLSFIVEYLHLQKPICFINKFNNTEELLKHFNEFGQLAIKQCYIAQNWDEIEHFIEEVVLKNNDYMQKQREVFFEKYLKINNGCCGKQIVNCFNNLLTEKEIEI